MILFSDQASSFTLAYYHYSLMQYKSRIIRIAGIKSRCEKFVGERHFIELIIFEMVRRNFSSLSFLSERKFLKHLLLTLNISNYPSVFLRIWYRYKRYSYLAITFL